MPGSLLSGPEHLHLLAFHSAHWVVSVLRGQERGRSFLSIVDVLPGGSVVPMGGLRDFGMGVIDGQGGVGRA